jgi:hypothetical protein
MAQHHREKPMADDKRTSKRRWKARCRLGREIPRWAILEHRLDRWFLFLPIDANRDFYRAHIHG